MALNMQAIEREARNVRNSIESGRYGIKNIFEGLNKLGYQIIRYPFGRDKLCGFATTFNNNKIIVTNSSEILAREIFTAAHELAHHIYDTSVNGNFMKVDKHCNGDEIEERRANRFAAAFLMPYGAVNNYLVEVLDKEAKEISPLDIVRIQDEFSTSYETTCYRLNALRIISERHRDSLLEYKEKYRLSKLFSAINANPRLLKREKIISVPPIFIEAVIDNYNNDHIPYESLANALSLVNIDAEQFYREPKEEELEEVDIDSLF